MDMPDMDASLLFGGCAIVLDTVALGGDCSAAMGAIVVVAGYCAVMDTPMRAGGYATLLDTVVLVRGCSATMDAVVVVGGYFTVMDPVVLAGVSLSVMGIVRFRWRVLCSNG